LLKGESKGADVTEGRFVLNIDALFALELLWIKADRCVYILKEKDNIYLFSFFIDYPFILIALKFLNKKESKVVYTTVYSSFHKVVSTTVSLKVT
jgi:hypothetical protein